MSANNQFDDEAQQLRARLSELKLREQEAQQNCSLLKEILDVLPLGLIVRDDNGELVLVNATAAAKLEKTVETPPAAADTSPREAGAIATHCQIHQRSAIKPIQAEETVSDPAGDRIWLTSCRPVRIHDRSMLLSTSLDITDRKHIEGELARRAYFDDLTGLPNRIRMQEHVEEILLRDRHKDRIALAFIDLDNFKHINDYHGHARGDALLVKVARRISGRLRESDMLARISGDEFVLLLDPIESTDQLRLVIDDLLKELTKPFYIEGFEILTSASIGVSVHPEHGRSYDALRCNADTAMYEVKRDAKGGVAFCNDETAQAVSDRVQLEQRLRLAIRDRKLCCAFQPKVDIHTQEVVGFETLVRWRDDDGMLQAPSSFIGLATELGLIDQITHFVLAQASGALDRLDDAFGAGGTISINVAAKQINNINFMRSLVEALDATGRARRFMLELTEDAFVAKNQFQQQVLPRLGEIGAQVSIDDFGTGYSSLSALADITADEIKIDRSFVTAIHERPRSQSVLKAVESLALALGMSIVAEGVETFSRNSSTCKRPRGSVTRKASISPSHSFWMT